MLTPISWLKDFVEINLPTKELALRLTEIGLGVESIKNIEDEEVLELEITPNRPDLLSIIGIAREIAAIENKSIKTNPIQLPKATKHLPIKINNDFSLFPRYCGVIIDNITIKPSPLWLQKRLILIGLRPINNVVDITNYVMFEYGIPLHAFDFNEIKGQEINVKEAKGGESFVTVDELAYKLPKGAIIIEDAQRIIDLCGIKGGQKSGIKNTTKSVYLQTTADDPLHIRRASQALALRSDASAIFERGVDKGGLLNTLKRAAQLTLELAGGEIASEIIDLKKQEFVTWKLKLSLIRLEKMLGVKIPVNTVVQILNNLSLQPVLTGNQITTTIPTYRSDLKIEEDLIEEVARIYGYNKFPLSLPVGETPTHKIAYYKDYSLEEKIKQLLIASGFSEIYTYSLISKDDMKNINFDNNKAIKITNPVSSEYEYLRPNLIINILQAIRLNQPYFKEINIFELGKIYQGIPPDTKEPLNLTLGTNMDYQKLKGVIEQILERLGINSVDYQPPVNSEVNSCLAPNKIAVIASSGKKIGLIGIIDKKTTLNFGLKGSIVICQLDYDALFSLQRDITFAPVPVYPALFEDISLLVKPRTYLGKIIDEIKKMDKVIKEIILLDSFKNTRTLRITYQDKNKNLSDKEVKIIREKILKALEEKYSAVIK